jgi:hypothetical protein
VIAEGIGDRGIREHKDLERCLRDERVSQRRPGDYRDESEEYARCRRAERLREDQSRYPDSSPYPEAIGDGYGKLILLMRIFRSFCLFGFFICLNTKNNIVFKY